MFYDIPRETRIALGIGLIVFAVICLLGLVVWCIIRHKIIHRRKQTCEHEKFCILCDYGYCINCNEYKIKE